MVQDTNKSINKQRLLGTRALAWPTGWPARKNCLQFFSMCFILERSTSGQKLFSLRGPRLTRRIYMLNQRQLFLYEWEQQQKKQGRTDCTRTVPVMVSSSSYPWTTSQHNNSEHPLGCELNGKLKNQVICVEFAQVSFTRTKRFSRSLMDLLILTDRCRIGNHSIYLSSVG